MSEKYIRVDELGVAPCNPAVFKNPERAHGWNALLNIVQSAPTYNPADILAGMWNIIKTRPMTEEERKEVEEHFGTTFEDEDAFILLNIPEDGQAVLVYYTYGGFEVDTFHDDDDGCYFENNGDMDGVVAWMPLPEPPKW